MRAFTLVRKKDVSGVSGTGEVAEGVEFHDGQIVISWYGRFHSVAIYPNIDDLMKIHGHEGSTEVVFRNVP